MKKRERIYRKDRLLRVVVVLFVITMLVPVGYELYDTAKSGVSTVETDDMLRKATVDKYETPEEVVEYVLYWIHQGDLDLALRGCAIEEISEGFSIESYCEVLDEFPYTDILAPADYEDYSYIEINRARMPAVFSDMAEQCMGIFGEGYEFEVLSITSDIPEDADGFYYQDIRDVCAITGARDACNVVIKMHINGSFRQMTVTTGRFRNSWKVIQFSEYKNYNYTEPQIEEYIPGEETKSLPMEWEELNDQMLPCQYAVVSDKSEKDIEYLARRWFLYMQRGDIWRAMSYFDIYDSSSGLHTDSSFYSKQSAVATKLQEFYYRLLLYNKNSLSWIRQNAKSEVENLLGFLDVTQARPSVSLTSVEITEVNEENAHCEIAYTYYRKKFRCEMDLIYRDGWKISNIEW